MSTTPIQNACRLLRETANELQQSHTSSRARDDWTGEPEAKAAYDEHMATADALEIETLRASHGQTPDTKTPILQWIMKTAERAKEPCGDDPESPAAVRNSALASIAGAAAQALGLVSGPHYWQAPVTDAERTALILALRALQHCSPNLTSDHAWQPDGWREQRAEAISACAEVLASQAAAPTTQPAPRHQARINGDSAAPKLRAMATNYTAGHQWDKLDAQACILGALEIEALRSQAPQPSPAAQGDALDAERYRYLRDGDWREHEKLESVIRLQLNTLWDETIDAARAAQEDK